MEETAVVTVLAGRVPGWPERERWKKTMNGIRGAILVATILLAEFFALNALGMSTELTGPAAAVVGLAAVAGGLWLIVGGILWRHDTEFRMKTAWYNEQADKRRLAAGSTLELCGDRVVYTDLRSRTVIFFDRVTACVETIDGFLLTADTARLLIRGGDVTAEQCDQVRTWLKTHLPAGVYRTTAAAIPLRKMPLPIPAFYNEDKVEARATLSRISPLVGKRLRRLTGWFMLPAALIYAAFLTSLVSATGHALLDMALYSGLLFLAWACAAWPLSLLHTKPVTVQLAFTRDGLAWNTDAGSDFLVWERLRVQVTARSLRLHFPDGTALTVPRGALDAPQFITNLAFGTKRR